LNIQECGEGVSSRPQLPQTVARMRNVAANEPELRALTRAYFVRRKALVPAAGKSDGGNLVAFVIAPRALTRGAFRRECIPTPSGVHGSLYWSAFRDCDGTEIR
jgi:hypothetical protein